MNDMKRYDRKVFKLRQSEADEIKLLIAAGVKQRQIAKDFNLSEAQISRIKHGHRWA